MELNHIKSTTGEVCLTNSKIISESIFEIMNSLPPGVQLLAAAKTRMPEEVQSAIHAGIKFVGYNYVQEAEKMYRVIRNQVQWHMIGHLQRNKVKKAVILFDMIETIDSWNLAETIDYHCAAIGKMVSPLA